MKQNKQGEWKNTCVTQKKQQTADTERVKNDHSVGHEPSQVPVVWGKHIDRVTNVDRTLELCFEP